MRSTLGICYSTPRGYKGGWRQSAGIQRLMPVAFAMVRRNPEHLLIASNRFYPALWETTRHPVWLLLVNALELFLVPPINTRSFGWSESNVIRIPSNFWKNLSIWCLKNIFFWLSEFNLKFDIINIIVSNVLQKYIYYQHFCNLIY